MARAQRIRSEVDAVETIDPLRDMLNAVLDRLDALTRQYEASVAGIERSHALDRRLMRMVLRNHHERLEVLEGKVIERRTKAITG